MDRSESLVVVLRSIQGFGQFVGPDVADSIFGTGLGHSTISWPVAA